MPKPKMNRTVYILLALIILAGAWLRLTDLGLAAMGPDRMEIWKTMNRDISVQQLLDDPHKFTGWFFFPLTLVSTRLFLDVFSLDPTFANVRLPFAIWGILAIPVAFGCGRRISGATGGLLFSLLIALHPYTIQMSRECYFHPSTLLGALFSLWTILWAIQYFRNETKLTILFHVVNTCGFFLLVHNRAIGWPLALLQALIIGGGLLVECIRTKKISSQIIGVAACYAIVGIPVVFSKWGLPLMFSEEYRAATQMIHGKGVPFFVPETWLRIYASWGWGNTWLRGGFTALIALGGGWALFANPQKRLLQVSAGVMLLSFLLCSYASTRTGFPMTSRYATTTSVFFLFFLSSGILFLADRLCTALHNQPPALKKTAAVILPAIALVLLLRPAWLCTRTTGEPDPYSQIAEWGDEYLPMGTPILCDRYFTPWNEFSVNAPENVKFMSTVPNEPLERYQTGNWQGSAMEFFSNNPDAVFYEQRMYWRKIGPWKWPHTFFAHKKTFVDEAKLELAQLGLAFRITGHEDPRERLTTTLYYNTRDDLLKKAAQQGVQILALYGTGWEYMKTRDFRDWRGMRSEATIDVINLSEEPSTIDLNLIGAVAGKSKRIQIEQTTKHLFGGKEATWKFPLHLNAGETKTVKLRSLGEKQTPLLLKRIDVSAPITSKQPAQSMQPKQ